MHHVLVKNNRRQPIYLKMAAGDVSSDKIHEEDKAVFTNWEKVKKDATCPGCKQFYKKPKLLTCCHVYCIRCVEEQFKIQEGTTARYFDCVVCQHRIPLKNVTEIDDLLDYQSSEYLGIMYRVRAEAKQGTPSCCNCDVTGSRISACCQCGVFFCESCVINHMATRNKEYHCILSVSELRNDQIPDPYSQDHEPPVCKHHADKQLQVSLYCHDCSELICCDCISDIHEGHFIESIPEAAKKEREVLKASMVEIQRLKEITDQRKAALERERDQLQIAEKEKLRRLKKAFNMVYKMLEDQKQKALDSVHHAADEAYAVLDEQEEQLLLLMEQLKAGTVPLDND